METPTGELASEEKTSDQRGRISVWVPIAFALTGLLIGFVTGLSETPVVGTLLPLLFTLIGGGAGFFAIQRKVGAEGLASHRNYLRRLSLFLDEGGGVFVCVQNLLDCRCGEPRFDRYPRVVHRDTVGHFSHLS